MFDAHQGDHSKNVSSPVWGDFILFFIEIFLQRGRVAVGLPSSVRNGEGHWGHVLFRVRRKTKKEKMG